MTHLADGECQYNHTEQKRTFSWAEGVVEMIDYYDRGLTIVMVNGSERCRYRNLTITEIEKLIIECAKAAEAILALTA